MDIDYLVVGQGLAGTLVAHELARRGLRYLIVDDHHRHASSVIAAGLYTPITGQRLVLTWRAEEFLAAAATCYRELENIHGVEFFHPLNTLRIFRNQEEHSLWEQKQDDPVLQPYLAARQLPVGSGTRAPFGGFELTGSGWLNLNRLLATVSENCIRRTVFDPRTCQVSPEGVSWEGVEARGVILCEGFQAASNPWFESLPFRNAHGEVLTLRIPDLPETHIVNSGIFLLPMGDQLFRVGATYDWDVSYPRITEAGRQTLLAQVAELIPCGVEVVDHRAGIRPIATQRVPVAGTHPEFPRIALLNGLGSKGVLYAPFYARQLVDHLETASPLDPEVELAKRMKPRRK